MRTFVTILGIAGAVVLLLLIGVSVAVWTVNPNDLVGPLQAQIKSATGRDVAIGGGIELKLGLVPKLVVNDVHVANAHWAKGPDVLSAKRVEVEVALLPLLQRRFELVRLNVIEPSIALETDDKGRGNWETAEAPGAPAAAKQGSPSEQGASAIPLGVDNLSMARGTLTYRDGVSGSETHVTIDELVLRARDAQSPVNAEFRGTIDGIAVALTGNLGPLSVLAQRRLPYPVAVQGEVNGRKTTVSAEVSRTDDVIDVQKAEVTSGSSDLKGRLQIRKGSARPNYTIELASGSLSLDDLVFAAPPPVTKSSPEGAGRPKLVFSDAPLPLAGLRAKDASGDIAVARLALPNGRALENVRLKFSLHDGKLDAPSFEATAFGGTISGRAKVDSSGKTPIVVLQVDGHDLDLGALLAATGVAREVRRGKTAIALKITSRGSSLHQWAATADGQAQITVGPATLVNPKVDPSKSFDRLAEAINPLRVTGASTELQCAVVRLPLSAGVARVDRSIALETKQLDATFSGTLDLRNETIDLDIRPRLRQGIHLDVGQFVNVVRIRGSFADPAIGIDAAATAAAIVGFAAAGPTRGLSLLGQAASGPSGSACQIALGTRGNEGSSSGNPLDVGGAVTSGVEQIGKALGGLFK